MYSVVLKSVCSVVLKSEGTQQQGGARAHELVGTRITLRGPSVGLVVLKKLQDTQQQEEARAHELVGTRTLRP